jgi:hypothetical protein
MSRKLIITIASIGCAFALSLGGASSAYATQRIDMKVLLLGTSTAEPDYQSWQSALQREGVPFESIITSPGHTPITAATLSSTLPTGTREAKYQAIIVPVAGLPECTTTCVETLSATEKTAIEEYEQEFHVRQITGDTFPNESRGYSNTNTAGALDGVEGTLTTAGKALFPYIATAGKVRMDTGTFGYEAAPLATQAVGASFESLLEGPSKTSLAGVYTHANGVQELVETFNQNAAQLQAELLRHGALNWATRGVYFGDQRNYYEADIDDNFLFDDSWNTTTHETDFNPEDALREVNTDVANAAKWSAENKFRIDMLFNGGGSVSFAEEKATTIGGIGGIIGKVIGGGGKDPLLAEFQKDKNDFGWISHTWDHPNIDIGCASKAYIEAELNENNAFAAEAPGNGVGKEGTGGLGLTASTSATAALGNNNPSVIITGEHSGLANLLPGNPGVVDSPVWESVEANTDELKEETAGEISELPKGTYTYAITDDFSPGGGESAASMVTVEAKEAENSVTLEWGAVCHAAQYKIYREVAGSNKWSLIDTIDETKEAAPPNKLFADPEGKSVTKVTGGGALTQKVIDFGAAGTESTAPSSVDNAAETAYPQNPMLVSAFTGVGVKYFGSDASKAYPNPTIAGSIVPAFAAGETFTDGPAQAIPRYPTNIYYNVSTEQQEVDEFNTLYTPVASGGKCVASPTNTCETAPATFAGVVSDVDTNMFQHLMGNDPRPHYFHQPNMMGMPPAGAPNGTPPNTSPNKGDGLFYSVVNPMLAQYKTYFNSTTAPIEQPTMAQIGEILAEQLAWRQASASQVTGYIEGSQVTINNSGAAAVKIPLTGVTGVGSSYGGIQSGWTSAAPATSTVTSPTAWPAAPEPVQQEPQGSWVGKYGSEGYLLGAWDGVQDASDMPNVTPTVVQGSRYQWAANSSDVRALQSPDGAVRNASTLYGENEVKVQLAFATARTTNIHLYAVDWDALGRRQTITVEDGSGPRTVALAADFSKGAWVSLPINVAAGGTVTITAQRVAGPNAVLSGVFLGEGGTPPIVAGQELGSGWVTAFGSAGYDLAGWDGTNGDVAYMPNTTVSLLQGSRYQWELNTPDVRALPDAGQHMRNAGAYYDPNQIQVKLAFNAAYTGNLHLYAVDWDSLKRSETISVNGQIAVLSSFAKGAWVTFPINVAAGGTVTITVDRTAGPNALLSGIMLGDAGAPPEPAVTSAPQGSWVNSVGSGGYDLAGWEGSSDLAELPNAEVSLLQGSRYRWEANSSDKRALTDPSGLTRNPAAYYDPNEIQVKLTFPSGYAGNLHLYAVDWDHLTRRELITVKDKTAVLENDFGEGAWVAFPINVAAGGSIIIRVDRTFGPNALLSGIFLGDAGTPPGPTVTTEPKGNWVKTFGSAGYDLAGWDGPTGDASFLPNASLNVVQGARFQWESGVSDTRALSDPGQITRNVGAYYDPNQIKLQLNFTAAYSGNLHLYAVDWDSRGRAETIAVNGQTAVLGAFTNGAWATFPINVAAGGTVTITVTRTAGPNALLSGIFLGDAGPPPSPATTSAPQGSWVGVHGSGGYVLGGWNGSSDLTSLSNASLTVEQATRFTWAASTSDQRALESPGKSTRVAATYYDLRQIQLKLKFTSAYSGNLNLYAVDWDSLGRRELISVNGQSATLSSDFSQGQWVSFPISVAAGGTVTIVVDRLAGPNAVLSGVFLG